MRLQQILPLQWKSTPYVVADHYRKKKSNDVEQIDYVFIAVVRAYYSELSPSAKKAGKSNNH